MAENLDFSLNFNVNDGDVDEFLDKFKNEIGNVEKALEKMGMKGVNLSNIFKSFAQSPFFKIGANIGMIVSGFSGLVNIVKEALGVISQLGKKIQEMIDEASSAMEAYNKVMVVFDENSKEANKALIDLRKNYGLTNLEASNMLGTLGNFYTALGNSKQNALLLSDATIKLAKDLSSFHNIDFNTVMENLQSGLTGQGEALKKYGIILNETILSQRALADGKKWEGLSEAEKAFYRLKVITEQSKNAIGDYARTQDSWANSMRRISAIVDDIKLSIGKMFIDFLLPIINNFMPGLVLAGKTIANIFSIIGGVLKLVIESAFYIVGVIVKVFDIIATGLYKFIVIPIQDVIVWVINVIGDVVSFIIKQVNKIIEALNKISAFKISTFKDLGEDIKNSAENFKKFNDNVKKSGSLFEEFKKAILGEGNTAEALEKLANLKFEQPELEGKKSDEKEGKKKKEEESKKETITTTNIYQELINKLINSLQKFSKGFEYLYNIVDKAFDTIISKIAPIIDSVLVPIANILEYFFTVVGDLFSTLLSLIQPLFEPIINILRTLIENVILRLMYMLYPLMPTLNLIVQMLIPVLNTISYVMKIVMELYKVIFNQIFIPLANLMIGLFNGVGRSFEDVVNWVIGKINWVIDNINKIPGIRINTLDYYHFNYLSKINPFDFNQSGGSSNVSSISGTSSSGLSVREQVPIYITINNNGVLVGFKNEDEFALWLKDKINTLALRGL